MEMLLSVHQKYILATLRELGCLRKGQLQTVVQGRFDWPEAEAAHRRMEAMLRQMCNGIGEFHSDAEFVWLGSSQPDARFLEAVDVMLELSGNLAAVVMSSLVLLFLGSVVIWPMLSMYSSAAFFPLKWYPFRLHHLR